MDRVDQIGGLLHRVARFRRIGRAGDAQQKFGFRRGKTLGEDRHRQPRGGIAHAVGENRSGEAIGSQFAVERRVDATDLPTRDVAVGQGERPVLDRIRIVDRDRHRTGVIRQPACGAARDDERLSYRIQSVHPPLTLYLDRLGNGNRCQ